MSMLKIALSGGIACGKSSFSQIFAKLGAAIIDFDILARKAVEPNTQGLNELITHFGTQILRADKSLNRGILRDKLFSSAENKQAIEAILHPKILAQMQIEISQLSDKMVIVVVPLLVENNLTAWFDRAIWVDCSMQNQLQRLKKRDLIDDDTAKMMIAAQASRQQRLDLCAKLPTDVIKNNGNLLNLEQKAEILYQQLVNL